MSITSRACPIPQCPRGYNTLSLSLSTIRRRASQSANRLPLNRAIYGSRDRKRGSFRGGYLCILAQLNSIKPGFLPPPAR